MKKYYFILVLSLLSLTACKKDKPINVPSHISYEVMMDSVFKNLDFDYMTTDVLYD